jgi:hypothetical protein
MLYLYSVVFANSLFVEPPVKFEALTLDCKNFPKCKVRFLVKFLMAFQVYPIYSVSQMESSFQIVSGIFSHWLHYCNQIHETKS